MLNASSLVPRVSQAPFGLPMSMMPGEHRDSPVPGEHPIPQEPPSPAPPTPSDPPVVPPSPVA